MVGWCTTLVLGVVAQVVWATEGFPDLFGIPVAGLTAPALLGITVLMILTGKLVPRRTYDDKVIEAAKWQQAHAISEEARLAQTKQLDAVMEVGETVQNVLLALQRVQQDRGDTEAP